MKKISPEVQRHLTAVANGRDAERDARARLQAETRERMTGMRAVTNAAIYAAWQAGSSKAAILRQLGTTNQYDVDDRIREHATLNGIELTTTPAGTVTAPDSATPSSSVLTVVRDGDTITVTMKGLTHPDVGTDVNGMVTYDTDGEVSAVEPADLFAQDPLMPVRIWGLPEVQAHA